MGHWSPIARALNTEMGKDEASGRIGKQCRERWNHHLMPDIRKVCARAPLRSPLPAGLRNAHSLSAMHPPPVCRLLPCSP